MKKKVVAGVGSPTNEQACSVSMLKLANRTAENIVTTNPKYGSKKSIVNSSFSGIVLRNATKMIMPGTIPNDTMSAKESNCLPNAE
mgnify:CR=1 FL=1